MRKYLWLLPLAAGLGIATCCVVRADDKDPTISDVMKKVNKGKDALQTQVKAALAGNKIEWDSVQKMTKEYSGLCNKLAKLEPPKGSKESWEKFTKKYADEAKTLDDASQKKDKEAAEKSVNNLQRQCNGCHKAHRES